jgi:hypothetical protein
MGKGRFRSKHVSKTRPQPYSAMPKALESVSNIPRIPSRPIQFRSISGIKALALALFFVISVLNAAFLLLQ